MTRVDPGVSYNYTKKQDIAHVEAFTPLASSVICAEEYLARFRIQGNIDGVGRVHPPTMLASRYS